MHDSYRIGNVRKHIEALTEITRWIWCVNLAAVILALVYARYALAGLAGFTWLAALVATASGRRASAYIAEEQEVVDAPEAPIDAREAQWSGRPSFWREEL